VDREFNGGAVHILGVEARAGLRLRAGGVVFPVGASYTFSRATFRTAFRSDNPEWGSVEVGDELPYLPAHQLQLTAGARGERWELSVASRHTSAMRDVAGQGEVAMAERTEAVHVVDVGGSVSFGAWGKVYVTVDNLLDDAAIVSRRPFGARPGVPRLMVLGWKKVWE
jgi:Fe(3+) dicitrate transport protein